MACALAQSCEPGAHAAAIDSNPDVPMAVPSQAIRFAERYPERVSKLVLVHCPTMIAGTLSSAGHWWAATFAASPLQVRAQPDPISYKRRSASDSSTAPAQVRLARHGRV